MTMALSSLIFDKNLCFIFFWSLLRKKIGLEERGTRKKKRRTLVRCQYHEPFWLLNPSYSGQTMDRLHHSKEPKLSRLGKPCWGEPTFVAFLEHREASLSKWTMVDCWFEDKEQTIDLRPTLDHSVDRNESRAFHCGKYQTRKNIARIRSPKSECLKLREKKKKMQPNMSWHLVSIRSLNTWVF